MNNMAPMADDPDRLIDEREAAGFLCYSLDGLVEMARDD